LQGRSKNLTVCKAATGEGYVNILTQFVHLRSIFWSRI